MSASLYYNVAKVIEYAHRDCGIPAEKQNAQTIDAAKQALQQILQDFSNRQELLFNLQAILLGTLKGKKKLVMPSGTIEVRNLSYRNVVDYAPTKALPIDNPYAANAFDSNLYNAPATATATENWFGGAFTTPTALTFIGINGFSTGAPQTYDLTLDYSSDGVVWSTFSAFTQFQLSDFEWKYFPLDGCPSSAYWRIRSTSTAPMIVRQIVFGGTNSDIPLYKMNRDDYYNLPNIDQQGQRSYQYWYDKQAIYPVVNLWPVPQDDFQVFRLTLEMQMADVLSLSDTIAIPNRWVRAVQAELSAHLLPQLHGADKSLLPVLQQKAQIALASAINNETDKSSSSFLPNVGGYTR